MRWSTALDRREHFRGRAALVAEVMATLAKPGDNVVLLGAGGAGKTALGIQALLRLEAENSATRLVHFAATTATQASPLAVFVSVLRDYERFANESPDRVAQAIIRACLEPDADATRKASASQLVIMVDDVPLLDNMSALVIDYLVSRTDVRLVLTCRSTPGLSPSLIRAWRDGLLARTLIPPLTHAEIAEITGELLAPKVLAPDTMARLVEVTGGNALFLTELLRSLDQSGALEERQGLWVWRQPLPADTSLTDIVRAQLAELSPEKRAAFETLALCAPVPLTMISAHLDLETVGSLADDGLVEFHQPTSHSPATMITVSHPIFGEVVSSVLNDAQVMTRYRALYEAAVADSVAASGTKSGAAAGMPDAVAVGHADTSELLTLVSWGLRGGCTLRLDLLQRTFDAVRDLADYEFRMSLAAALLRHPEADDSVRALALTNRIEAYRFTNNPVGVAHDQRAAQAILERMPSTGARSDAVVDLALVAADAHVLQQGDWSEGLGVLDWAEHLVLPIGEHAQTPADQSRLQRINIARGIYLSYAGRMKESVELQRALYAQMQSSADFLPLASTLVISLAQRGDSKRTRAVARQQMGLAVRSMRRYPLAVGDMVGAWCLADMFAGNVREASIIYNVLNATIERNPGHVRVRSTLVAFGRGLLAISQGEWESAVSNLKVACSELEDFSGTGSEGLLLASLALAHAAVGDREGAAQARQLFDERGERTSKLLEVPARYNLLLASLYAPNGTEADEARQLVAVAKEYDFALMELRAIHALALTSPRGLDDTDLHRARGLAAQIGSPLAKWILGSCEHITAGGERGIGPAARALARRGLFIPASQPFDGLTAREQQLAQLLALGFSNNQIAGQLGISKRTVESHAAKVLQKLQVSSRDDVASALEALHLFD